MCDDIMSMSNDKLLLVLKKMIEDESGDISYFLNDICDSITTENAPIILSFFHSYFENKTKIVGKVIKDHMSVIIKIFDNLKVNLPSNLYKFIPDLNKYISENNENIIEDNIIKIFGNIIKETLIKCSTYEIINAINFNINKEENVDEEKDHNISDVLIFYMENLNFSKKEKIFKSIIPLLNDESLPTLLTYFLNNSKYSELFFIFLKFFNKGIYEKAIDLIYTEKKFFKANLLKSLPEIDHEKIINNIRDYNWDIVEHIVNVRPDFAGEVARSFANNDLKVPRNFFLEKIVKEDKYFSYYIEDMNLNDEELVDLSNKSKRFLLAYYKIINKEEQMIELCKIICKEENSYILDFLKNNDNKDKLELLIKALTQTMRFTGELKEYIIENFAKKRKYFHTLITYLELDEIEYFLNEYYEPEVSIEGLLRKLHPQELLLQVHMFIHEELAMKLIEECIYSNKFALRDWIFLLKSNELSKSKIKIRTIKLLLEKKIEIKDQIIIFMRSCIPQQSCKSKRKIDELIKSIELLENDGITILELMKKDLIKRCLKKSSIIRKFATDYLKNNKNKINPFIKILKKSISK